jgi:hypothetical protein
VTVEEAIGRNKQTCSICRGDREENYCSTETKKLQIQRGKLQDLEERIRGMNSWEQLAEVALKPLDAEVMNVVHRLADIEQIEDPAERKSLALIFLELENLREVITDKTSDLEKQKKQRPTNLGRDFERLSSGLNFSVDQPKEPQFSFDLLTCLQLKLSKSNAVMPLENCSAVFRAIGF